MIHTTAGNAALRLSDGNLAAKTRGCADERLGLSWVRQMMPRDDVNSWQIGLKCISRLGRSRIAASDYWVSIPSQTINQAIPLTAVTPDRPCLVLLPRLLSFAVFVSVYLSLSVCDSALGWFQETVTDISSSISTAWLSFNQFVISPSANLLVHVNMSPTRSERWEIPAWYQFRFDACCQSSLLNA